ncbi:MAG: FAD-dependent oxidoreductase [Coriobacteriales bacterium]|nr:FAD-dependent oxidoreductase [Coriobacteriales bacterium]
MGPSFNEFPHVFSPIDLGPVQLKNRIQFSPTVSAHCERVSGEVTPSMVAYIGAQARSGAGLVTIGSSPVNHDEGRDFLGCLSVVRDTDVPGLGNLAKEAHIYGAKISAELIHAGRIANPIALKGQPAWVCSLSDDLAPNREYHVVTKADLQKVIADFVAAARRLKQAGFDMLMIHGAHGNLVSSFLSPVFNTRTDEYGGSLNNRMRFQLELLEAVRAEIGPDMGIEYRISSWEYKDGSPSVEDIAAFLKEAGKYINLANLSGGLICDLSLVQFMMPSYLVARNINVERTARIRELIDTPVAAVGNIPDIYAAEEIVATGKADIVAMARNMVADIELPKKAWRGQADRIKPCLHCNLCITTPGLGQPVRCSVSPTRGRELQFEHIAKADKPGRVMVIGGGPAGMQAAQIATLRGHKVDLYEAEGELGGRLREASAMWCKDYFRRYLKWSIRETEECGATIHLNTKVTPELIEAEKPDFVVLAIGADHIVPKIPGIDGENVINVTEADLRLKPVGKRVVFCGAGLSSTEAGIDLAHEEGCEVTLIDMLPANMLMREIPFENSGALKDWMKKLDIKLIDEAKVCSIGDGYVEYERNGEVARIECDTVVTSFGLKPDAKVVDELRYVVPDTVVVGDANEARNIYWANHDAFNQVVWL